MASSNGNQNLYSIWVVPQGETGKIAQDWVDKLAKKYGFPSFVPHLTIIPDLNSTKSKIIDATDSFIRGVFPLEIQLRVLV